MKNKTILLSSADANFEIEPLEDRMLLTTIDIFAAGQVGDETIELEINGEVVQTFENVGGDFENSEFQTLSYSDSDNIDISEVRVLFTNDGLSGGVDRNVRVGSIVVNGDEFQTEAPDVFSLGSFRESDGCDGGFKESELLNCNGFFRFTFDVPTALPGVTGSALVNNQNSTIDFGQILENPIVIAGPPTTADTDPGAIDIQGVTATGFEARFREWTYLSQDHDLEKFDWIALEAGSYQTSDGSLWEAGTLEINGNGRVVSKDFETLFSSTPNLFLTVQTSKGSPVIVRARDVSESGFSAAIYEEQRLFLEGGHTFETVGYLAIEPAAGSGVVTINGQTIPYLFQDAMVNDKFSEISPNLELRMEEETSFDEETRHAKERVNILTLGSQVFAQDVSTNGGDVATLRAIRVPNTIELPEGFRFREIIPEGSFENPVALEVAPDGRIFVAEEGGLIWAVKNGEKLDRPYLDLSDKVLDEFADSGAFSGFVLDPNFDENGFLYVMYTTSVDGDEFGRVERYTQGRNNPDVVNPNSAKVLLGNSSADGLIKDNFHNVGDLEFGSDSTLFISWGDTATNEEDDDRMFRSQDLDVAAGKLFRIDARNGRGLSSNPFFNGDPNAIRSKVWAFGLRNGFRYEIDTLTGSTDPKDGNPGTVYIADVGRFATEEINVSSGGENFGWPFFEGNNVFRDGGEGVDTDPPAFVIDHPAARSVIGGTFYRGTQWPEIYADQFFVADFVEGWFDGFKLNESGELVQTNFATGIKGVTDVEFDSNSGEMLLIGRGKDIIFSDGEGLDGLYRIFYVGDEES